MQKHDRDRRVDQQLQNRGSVHCGLEDNWIRADFCITHHLISLTDQFLCLNISNNAINKIIRLLTVNISNEPILSLFFGSKTIEENEEECLSNKKGIKVSQLRSEQDIFSCP